MGSLEKFREQYRKERRRQTIPRLDNRMIEAMVALRQFVDNQGKQPTLMARGEGGVYRPLEHDEIKSIKFDGIVIGYKLVEKLPMIEKQVFIKIDGENLDDIPRDQLSPIMNSVFEVFLDRAQGLPDITRIAIDSAVMKQQFLPLILTRTADGERNFRVKRYT